ncbi:unnamed protein product [Dibothriocephalus latus]|uniref:Uncharacterized protein n=1 Tax=Dibothriocephalus latus TaxID=60516 RepID=A0A3P7P2X3_DIBLA|nr:unnamed protein product [Dibothriocephalus latus]
MPCGQSGESQSRASKRRKSISSYRGSSAFLPVRTHLERLRLPLNRKKASVLSLCEKELRARHLDESPTEEQAKNSQKTGLDSEQKRFSIPANQSPLRGDIETKDYSLHENSKKSEQNTLTGGF